MSFFFGTKRTRAEEERGNVPLVDHSRLHQPQIRGSFVSSYRNEVIQSNEQPHLFSCLVKNGTDGCV